MSVRPFAAISAALLLFSGTPTAPTAPVLPVECKGTCAYCDENYHMLITLVEYPNKIFDVGVSCSQQLQGSCDFYPDCGFATRDAMERIWYAAAQNNVDAVQRFLRDHPERAVFVAERGAVQILDCDGQKVLGQVAVDNIAAHLSQY